MEIYTLNSNFEREQIVDLYDSLIWTERLSSYGDFELHISSSAKNRKLFSPGTRLVVNQSYRVMTVETVEDSIDEAGMQILVIKGRSLESILDDRIARVDFINQLDPQIKYQITGLPADNIRQLISNVVVVGEPNIHDVFPALFSSYPPMYNDAYSNVPEPQDSETWDVPLKSLYEAVREHLDVYDLGFRITRHPESGQLYFDVFAGVDRTSQQEDYNPVIFARALDNLQNITQFQSTVGSKNVAYVFSETQSYSVYAQDVPESIEGFDRKVLTVDATDITEENAALHQAMLIQRGKEELAKYRPFMALDGEVAQNSEYQYDIDYRLGDLVEMRSEDGQVNLMRVTEQILVSDKQGVRSYPTLMLHMFIRQGTWLSWDYDQVWADMGLEEYWENQP